MTKIKNDFVTVTTVHGDSIFCNTEINVTEGQEVLTLTPVEKKKTAIIFGVTGMDGSHLSDLLLEKGYKVVGVKRRSSTNNEDRISHLTDHENFQLVCADITDVSSLMKVFIGFREVDEVYNLAAQSHVGESFKQPGLTWDVTGKGCMNILQCLVDLGLTHVRFYQASSSEMFGANYDFDLECYEGVDSNGQIYGGQRISRKYQNEDTKHLPQSPYAIAKCAAHQAVRLYREAYGIHGSCGILFNHEGPRRGENFVTRKITKWIAEFYKWRKEYINEDVLFENCTTEDYIEAIEIKGPTEKDQKSLSKFPKLRLGNLEAKRDWGHAKDYVKAMHMMLQQDKPDDYVICTEETRSVRDFLDVAFSHIDISDWEQYVVIDPEFYRPAEVDFLIGDCSKAREKLNWQRDYSFDDLVKEMVEHDINKANEKV